MINAAIFAAPGRLLFDVWLLLITWHNVLRHRAKPAAFAGEKMSKVISHTGNSLPFKKATDRRVILNAICPDYSPY